MKLKMFKCGERHKSANIMSDCRPAESKATGKSATKQTDIHTQICSRVETNHCLSQLGSVVDRGSGSAGQRDSHNQTATFDGSSVCGCSLLLLSHCYCYC